MKKYLLITLIGLISFSNYGQTTDSTGRFVFALNSSLNGELTPIRMVPSIAFLKGKSQFELGFGLNLFSRITHKILTGEFNYKYFPNGAENKFNMYLIGRFSYINNRRNYYYPSTYNYLFLNGGYGFQISPFKNAYLGTNISIGTFSYSKRSEVPYPSFTKTDLFDEFGFNLAFQFNLGYRF
jgi:hypothetical protein